MNFMENSSHGGSSNSMYGRIGSCGEFGSGSFSISNNGSTGSIGNTFMGLDSGIIEISQEPRVVVRPLLPSRYESQKRSDWNTFNQYLRNHRPPLPMNMCNGAHVLEFLRYLDQFGKTKVHNHPCPYFGIPKPPSPCACPLRQAWGSLDALVGRLRAAYEEHGGRPETNPLGARAVRLYLREAREYQAKARGVSYEKKRKRMPPKQKPIVAMTLNSTHYRLIIKIGDIDSRNSP